MVSDKEITLGEFLRHERESRGITLEQVASTTKIGVRTLHALEADHYAELPAKPFIRGFVTSYCRFIGLDAADTLSRFDTFVNTKSLERPSRESGHSGYAFDKKDGQQQSRAILTVAIASFIGIGAVVLLFFKPVLSRHRVTQVDQLKAAAQQQQQAQVPFGPVQAPATSSPASSSPVIEDEKASDKKAEAEVNQASPRVGAAIVPEATPLPTPSVSEIEVPPIVSPIPISSPSPEKSESEKKLVIAAPPVETSPTPSPTVEKDSAPVEGAATPELEEPKQKAGSNPKDPLDSGVGIKVSEIKHKLSCKMLEDNWVRYQVDDLPVRKFIVRKGKVLVLRGKKQVVLQVSHPETVNLTYNGQAAVAVADHPAAEEKKGSWTLSYPKTTPFPFEKDRALPEVVDPSPSKKAEEPAPETGPVR